MSRYSLKPLKVHPNLFEVAVGWDAALDTYFILVFGAPDEARDPTVRLWRGTCLREITSTGVLIAIARAFAELPEDLAARLHLDRITAPHNPEASISSLMVELLARPSPTCD